MSSVALKRRLLIRGIMDFAPLIAIVVALVGIGWGTWHTISAWHRGIYAGFHYGDAKGVVVRSLVADYGKDFAAKMHFANPPVVNTHGKANIFGKKQLRVFHVIGPAGTKYCITVSDPGYYWTGDKQTGIDVGGATLTQKNCKF